jgi:hypothetical protein
MGRALLALALVAVLSVLAAVNAAIIQASVVIVDSVEKAPTITASVTAKLQSLTEGSMR